MTIFEVIISGIVQGVTEFLPVSSSGHLVVLHKFFGLKQSSISFDVCLHLGTFFAVVVYFAKDIKALVVGKRYDWFGFIAIGIIPAIIAALFFGDRMIVFFVSSRKVSWMFLVTGTVLFLAQAVLWYKPKKGKEPTLISSLIVGISQAFALIPGISRSGITVSSGLIAGMDKDEAFKFSFLMAAPLIFGAALLKATQVDWSSVSTEKIGAYSVGMIVAFLVGLACLPLLKKVIRSNKLYIFGIYCLLLGIVGILFWSD